MEIIEDWPESVRGIPVQRSPFRKPLGPLKWKRFMLGREVEFPAPPDFSGAALVDGIGNQYDLI